MYNIEKVHKHVKNMERFVRNAEEFLEKGDIVQQNRWRGCESVSIYV